MWQDRATDKTLIIGVDVHRQMNVAQLVDGGGRRIGKPITMRNNLTGIREFGKQLETTVAEGGYGRVQLGTEATNRYGQGMFYTLQRETHLKATLYALNPRLTANYKKTLLVDDHTDASDASVIAGRLRMGESLPAPFEQETVYQPLRLLTRQRFHVAQQLAHEKAYATNLIYLKYSEYTVKDKRPFAETFGQTSRAVLREFASREELLAMPQDELAEWLQERGQHRFGDPQAVARKVQDVVRESFIWPVEFNRPLNLSLDSSLSLIEAFERQRKRLDDAIAQAMQAIPNTLTTIPGIGPVCAAGILAEIGDVHRFDDDDDKIAKLAGLKWRKHQSGDFEAENTPITFQCNRYLRFYLVQAANLVRRNDPEYAAYYQKKFAEATRHRHKRAIVLTARKLVRLVTRLLASHEPYRLRSLPKS